MNRREFFRSAAALPAMLGLSTDAIGLAAAQDTGWREFVVTTTVEVQRPSGPTRVWVPVPLLVDTVFQRGSRPGIDAPGGRASLTTDPRSGASMIAAEWPAGVRPTLTTTSRVATRDVAVDLTAPGRRSSAGDRGLDIWLQPTRFVPTDGIVRQTAEAITRGARTPREKARAIYEWIVENTFRNPDTRGCGLGDIRFMLETKSFGGKCADINALFVGLARAVGLPARDAYGLRVAPSASGLKSLGISSPVATRAQHCRAEVHLPEYGWVPVDPADVRKVMLEEPPGHLTLDSPEVARVRARLFGSWEMNWIAYNFAHDVALPGSARRPLGFLMYPQAETADGALDSLDADGFRYVIKAATA